MDGTFSRVQNTLFNHLSYGQIKDPSVIQKSHKLIDDLHADSLDLLEIGMALESTFQIEIPDDDMEKWSTVGDVLTYLEARGL